MLEATLWGLLGASSLLLGALIALTPRIHEWLVARHEWRLGLLMAFGAGVLVSAVAFDLFEEAVATSVGGLDVAVGFALGALAFFVGDELIDRLPDRTRATTGEADVTTDEPEGGNPVGILLGAVLDGIPESIVIGISLLDGSTVSVAVLAAVFLSNVPEAIASTPGLAARYGVRPALLLWTVVVLASGIASGLGFGLLGGASPSLVAAIQAFAAGGILVMLTDEMIPGAHAKGHTAAGLATAFGFAVAALLSFGS